MLQRARREDQGEVAPGYQGCTLRRIRRATQFSLATHIYMETTQTAQRARGACSCSFDVTAVTLVAGSKTLTLTPPSSVTEAIRPPAGHAHPAADPRARPSLILPHLLLAYGRLVRMPASTTPALSRSGHSCSSTAFDSSMPHALLPAPRRHCLVLRHSVECGHRGAVCASRERRDRSVPTADCGESTACRRPLNTEATPPNDTQRSLVTCMWDSTQPRA